MAKIKKSKVSAKKVETDTKDVKDDGYLDMIIAFDTTGSMSAYIGSVKQHVRELVPELFNTNKHLQIGVVAFGDYCDMNGKDDFGNAYQSIGLTRNENDVINFINEAKNTGGGDGDEFYELVLRKIIDETQWRDNAKRSILLIADADPHPLGYSYSDYVENNDIDWKEEAKRASDMGIQIDTLGLSWQSDGGWYKQLSQMTNGVFAPFKTNGKTDELIKAAAWSRGGSETAEIFAVNSLCYCSCDSELSGTYTAFSKNVSDFDTIVNSKEVEELAKEMSDTKKAKVSEGKSASDAIFSADSVFTGDKVNTSDHLASLLTGEVFTDSDKHFDTVTITRGEESDTLSELPKSVYKSDGTITELKV